MILEISNNERYMLLMALANWNDPTFHAFKDEPPAERHKLIERTAALGVEFPPPPAGEGAAERTANPLPMSGTKQARAILAPPAKPILWADGKPKPDAKKLTMTILRTLRKDSGNKPRMLLTMVEHSIEAVEAIKWALTVPEARELTKAIGQNVSVWDVALFAPVANKVNQPWTYYLTYSADGKYANLAGMEQP